MACGRCEWLRVRRGLHVAWMYRSPLPSPLWCTDGGWAGCGDPRPSGRQLGHNTELSRHLYSSPFSPREDVGVCLALAPLHSLVGGWCMTAFLSSTSWVLHLFLDYRGLTAGPFCVAFSLPRLRDMARLGRGLQTSVVGRAEMRVISW